jgi:putative N6-adenine-specific DNA methylase
VASPLLRGFAVCPSGLEEALAAELTAMKGFRDIAAGRAGVAFSASPECVARANIWARLPTRLLIEVGRGVLRQAQDVRAISTRIAWEKWFQPRQTIRVDLAVAREPRLSEPLARNFATLLVKDGVCDRFRTTRNERPSVDTTHPDIRIWAFIDQNNLTIYLDTSGEPLFKRGWRQGKGEAPLRENLAAALIAMTPWDKKMPLMDPFCGSGTFLIEAMQMALGLPPGYLPSAPRSFAAERFHPQSPMGAVNWKSLRAEAGEAIARVSRTLAPSAVGSASWVPLMQGSDRDPSMIRIAQANATRALPEEAARAITWTATPVAQLRPIAATGLMLGNPPYGVRLEKSVSEALPTAEPGQIESSFERNLAETLKQNFSGWQVWLLTDDLRLERSMRLKAARRIPVFNGDIECRWMRFDMVAGSMRGEDARKTPEVSS